MINVDSHLISRLQNNATGADIHSVVTMNSNYTISVKLVNELIKENNPENDNEIAMFKEFIEFVETAIRRVINGSNAKIIEKEVNNHYLILQSKHGVRQ